MLEALKVKQKLFLKKFKFLFLSINVCFKRQIESQLAPVLRQSR